MFLTATIVVIAIILIGGSVETNDWAITPGNSESVNPLVTVTGLKTNHQPDSVLLVDVYLEQLNVFQWIKAHFESNIQIIPSSELVPSGVPTAELTAQGYIDMTQAKQFAEAAALDTLGWKIPARGAGAILYDIEDPSPAYSAGLNVADIVVSADGKPVTSACSLIDALQNIAPKAAVALGVESASISSSGTIAWGAAHTVSATSVAAPANTPTSGCSGARGAPRSLLGIGVEDVYDYTFPGHIAIATPNIGGPSAGLAMTLTLINELSAGSLTGHHVIAATGTMAANGQVGEIGGIAEKTVAVENAGAAVFIVPTLNLAAAKGASNGKLIVLGVNTLAQALHDLRALGGAAPTPLTAPYALRPPS
jgi:Lon-like protease